uniref:Avh287 n=1 Tax=Phytophthora sojae TaxID=67593 RepID=G1FSL8_PHYSO|nr:Avh287 [Phytophthora sojae]AEK81107.1 Avh287 [Phytophthora sojae]
MGFAYMYMYSITLRFLRAGGDDEDERAFGIPSMSTITETAMKIPGASTVAGMAKTLPGASMVGDLAQKMQYQYWLKMNKTPDEVKTILGLDNFGAKILDNPNLDVWIRFAIAYNKRNNLPESKIISDLLKMMPADRVMKLPEKLPVSAKTIDNVENYVWLYMNKTPSDVYKLLGLDRLGKEILDSPGLYVWIRYKRI